MDILVTADYAQYTRTQHRMKLVGKAPSAVHVEVTLDPADAELLEKYRATEVSKKLSKVVWTLQGNVLRVTWTPHEGSRFARENAVLETCGTQTRLWVMEMLRDVRRLEAQKGSR